ncbi:MAG: hypothetical protein NTX86_04095 [Candidatus Dependentiae bacterium]|nr:hypothetical protein [Candidatus Dependentiae bacterium]
MNEHPFQAFIKLISADKAILAIENSLAALKTGIVELNKQEQQLAATVQLAKDVMHDARKEVDARELELKALEQQEKQKQERLDNATDYKQYQLFKAEIEVVKHKQHAYEEILMDVWNILESAQKSYDHIKEVVPQKIDVIHADIKKNESEIATLQTQLDEAQAQRAVSEKPVPQEWLEKYAVMRSRVEDPVVPIQNGSCSACFYKINEQDLLMLRRRALLQCLSCYRLLYSTELERASGVEAS